MKNIAASIQDRLKNRSRESGVSLNRLLEDFAIGALRATFERRSTDLPVSTPSAFTETFYSLPDKQTQWAAFLRKSRLEPLELQDVCEQIARFLGPAITGAVSGKRWLPKGGWTEV